MAKTTTAKAAPSSFLEVKKISGDRASLLLRNVRFAFVSIAAPRRFKEGEKPNYLLTALVDASEWNAWTKILKEVAHKIISASKLSAKEKKDAFENAIAWGEPGSLLRQGENFAAKESGDIYDGFEGHFAFQCKTAAEGDDSSGYAPKVAFPIVGPDNRPIARDRIEEFVYSGAYGNVMAQIKPYGKIGGNAPGVTRYLAGVQFIRHGERLGVANYFEAEESAAEETAGFGEDSESDDIPF